MNWLKKRKRWMLFKLGLYDPTKKYGHLRYAYQMERAKAASMGIMTPGFSQLCFDTELANPDAAEAMIHLEYLNKTRIRMMH